MTPRQPTRDRAKRKTPPPWLPDLPRPTGRQIATARKAAGMTQDEAARVMMLYGATFVSDIERGKRDITYLQWWRFLLVTGQHPTLKLVEKTLD